MPGFGQGFSMAQERRERGRSQWLQEQGSLLGEGGTEVAQEQAWPGEGRRRARFRRRETEARVRRQDRGRDVLLGGGPCLLVTVAPSFLRSVLPHFKGTSGCPRPCL